MKAARHLEAWSLAECKTFLTMYLNTCKHKDERVVCDDIAASLKRTYDAIKLRVQEVRSILTDGEYGLRKSKQTPNMIQAVDEISRELNMSRVKMEILFN